MARKDIYKYKKSPKVYRKFEIAMTVLAGLLVVCAYAGLIDPNDFFPAPFMMLAFMPLLILAVIMLIIALFARRSLAVLILAVGLVVTLPITHKFLPVNTSENTPPMPVDQKAMLSVMTYNVLGFNHHESTLGAKPSSSMKLILDTDPDVVLLQEGNAGGVDWDQLPELAPYKQRIASQYPYCYQGTEGLNIMSKYPFTTVSLGEPLQGRSPLGFNRNQTSYIARAFDLQLPSGKQLRLINFRLQSFHLSFGKNMSVRVSPDVKPSPFERMRRSFALRGENATALRHEIDKSPKTVIVCGDMNDVSASHVYRLISGDDLKDAWCNAGLGYGNTYNRHGLCYRIDHILYRGELRPLHGERIKGGSSDHYPLMVTFDIDVDAESLSTDEE